MLFFRYVVKGEEAVGGGEGLTTRLWQVTVRKGACPPTPAHTHTYTLTKVYRSVRWQVR